MKMICTFDVYFEKGKNKNPNVIDINDKEALKKAGIKIEKIIVGD